MSFAMMPREIKDQLIIYSLYNFVIYFLLSLSESLVNLIERPDDDTIHDVVATCLATLFHFNMQSLKVRAKLIHRWNY